MKPKPNAKRLLLIITFAFTSLSSLAYKKDGHEMIEKWAYHLLKEMPAVAGQHPDGKTMMKWLQDEGYLYKDGLPHSAYPDYSSERQFAQDKQMFHFMASTEAVFKASLETSEAAQRHRLLVPALSDCLRMMYFFSKEILDNPEGASQAGRGTYVLIHLIEDSYSVEHTTRDANGKELLTVKGWELSQGSWPAAATTSNADGSMRLLHRGKHAVGDDDWAGPQPSGLSPLALVAAKNVAGLLFMLYVSANNQAGQDTNIANYFKTYYKPAGGIESGTVYTFNGNQDSIRFDYSGEYERHPGYVTFAYDRSARMTLMAIGSTGFKSAHPISAYGLEWQWFFISPRAADSKYAALQRLPLGLGLALNAVSRSGNYSYTDNLLAKGFLKTTASLPWLGLNIEPFAGVSTFAFNSFQRSNAIVGVDFSSNVGKDWGIAGATIATRFSFGYEADFSGYPATHNLTLKLGFNTFNGRVINKNNKKVLDPKK
jgi:hypothetical protein